MIDGNEKHQSFTALISTDQRESGMARRKNGIQAGPGLFEPHERHFERRLRRQRALFIPRFLREAAANLQLKGAAQDRAFDIAVRWADLETDGHLPQYKETSIDTQFLDQLFGEGLGYQVKTTSPTEWQLEHKFPVPGVGTADAALGEFPRSRGPTIGGRTQGCEDRPGPRPLQRPDRGPAMLGLSQRAAGVFVGNRLQFPHDSLVSPRKGVAVVRGVRAPRAAETRSLRRVLLPVRAGRTASFCASANSRERWNCCAAPPNARRTSATTCTRSIIGGGSN